MHTHAHTHTHTHTHTYTHVTISRLVTLQTVCLGGDRSNCSRQSIAHTWRRDNVVQCAQCIDWRRVAVSFRARDAHRPKPYLASQRSVRGTGGKKGLLSHLQS